MSVAGGVIGFSHPNPAIAFLVSTLFESTHMGHAGLCERIGDLVDKEIRFRHFSLPRKQMPAQPKRSQNQRLGFQIEINESKTPGHEHCLDPPGAELLAWL
jgi:hypothetical protein